MIRCVTIDCAICYVMGWAGHGDDRTMGKMHSSIAVLNKSIESKNAWNIADSSLMYNILRPLLKIIVKYS